MVYKIEVEISSFPMNLSIYRGRRVTVVSGDGMNFF